MAPATFRREGDYWVIGYKAPAFRLKDRIGLRYLAMLLSNPGREFLAVDLAAAVHGGHRKPSELPPASGPPLPSLPKGDYREAAVLGGGELYFDDQARRAYTQRLRALREALEEAQAFNDRERASRTQAEIDTLTDELQRGIGLGRRIRTSGSPVERARISVTLAIRGALRAIAKNDAALGRYLATTIKTGTFCSYNPDPGAAVRWQL